VQVQIKLIWQYRKLIGTEKLCQCSRPLYDIASHCSALNFSRYA